MGEACIEYFKMELAGRKIEVEINYRYVFHYCRDYLSSFKHPDFVINVSLDEIIAARPNRIDLPKIPGIAVCYADEYTEAFVAYSKIADAMLNFDTFLMHGSVVAKDNYAYLFSASSGVGKTTRTRIWLEEYPDSIVVNGDKPLIRLTETEAVACGTPWCGKEGWNANTMVPLRAIFLLERAAEGARSSIEEMSLGKAFPLLLQQTHRPNDPILMRKTLQLLKEMDSKVKIYKFKSTPTPDAIRLAYETARPK